MGGSCSESSARSVHFCSCSLSISLVFPLSGSSSSIWWIIDTTWFKNCRKHKAVSKKKWSSTKKKLTIRSFRKILIMSMKKSYLFFLVLIWTYFFLINVTKNISIKKAPHEHTFWSFDDWETRPKRKRYLFLNPARIRFGRVSKNNWCCIKKGGLTFFASGENYQLFQR